MPEGPEIAILCDALKAYYPERYFDCYGKHLFYQNTKNDLIENWSFGLNGKVKIDENDALTKVMTGFVYGAIEFNTTKIGKCWLKTEDNLIKEEINKWTKSRKALGGLLLDQNLISGIGIAWGSEILHKAGLRPDLKACEQDLSNLYEALVDVRNYVINLYKSYFKNITKKEDVKEFINGWYTNLYSIRNMEIYKKGKEIKVAGRTWHVK